MKSGVQQIKCEAEKCVGNRFECNEERSATASAKSLRDTPEGEFECDEERSATVSIPMLSFVSYIRLNAMKSGVVFK